MAKDKSELKMNISDEERERRSERAKALHAKGKGRFGGTQEGAGRPKKERAQEQVAERVKGEADSIFRALKDGLGKKNSASHRLKAALALLEIEQREAEFQLKQEDRIYNNMSRSKMLELLQEKINMLRESGVDFNSIIEGKAEEIIQQKEIENGG